MIPFKSAVVLSSAETFYTEELTVPAESICDDTTETELQTETTTALLNETKANRNGFTSLSEFKNTGLPISELDIPEGLTLDENGIPTDYVYCVDAKATAYTGDPATASGRVPMPGHIAVNPKEYPYGTELYIVSADGKYVYGYCIAADTGGFVKMGNTDVDVYMDNEEMCREWGNKAIKIYILKE